MSSTSASVPRDTQALLISDIIPIFTELESHNDVRSFLSTYERTPWSTVGWDTEYIITNFSTELRDIISELKGEYNLETCSQDDLNAIHHHLSTIIGPLITQRMKSPHITIDDTRNWLINMTYHRHVDSLGRSYYSSFNPQSVYEILSAICRDMDTDSKWFPNTRQIHTDLNTKSPWYSFHYLWMDQLNTISSEVHHYLTHRQET